MMANGKVSESLFKEFDKYLEERARLDSLNLNIFAWKYGYIAQMIVNGYLNEKEIKDRMEMFPNKDIE